MRIGFMETLMCLCITMMDDTIFFRILTAEYKRPESTCSLLNELIRHAMNWNMDTSITIQQVHFIHLRLIGFHTQIIHSKEAGNLRDSCSTTTIGWRMNTWKVRLEWQCSLTWIPES